MAALAHARRIAIVGNQGAGKTTLALAIAEATGVPFIDRDWIADGPVRAIDALAGHACWVVDGDFGLVDHADLVIHVDLPRGLCLWRALRRSATGAARRLAWNRSEAVPHAFAARPARRSGLRALLRVAAEIARYDRPAKMRAYARGNGRLLTLRSAREVSALLQGLREQPGVNHRRPVTER